MSENPPKETRHCHRYKQRNGKSEGTCLHAVDEVHTKETGYQRGEHHKNGYRGERTHHCVHVVIDDARIGVHGRFKNVGIDVGGLSRLSHLDIDILDKVGIQLVDLELELQLRQEVLIATDRGDEIGERVLQAAQTDEALVVHLLVEITFRLLYQRTYLLESFQIPHCRG